MKLLIVVNVDWFFLSHRLPIAIAAKRAGWDVHIATALTIERSEIEKYGFTLHPLKLHRTSSSPVGLGQLVVDLVRLFRKVNPEVLHLVTIKPVLMGGIAARLTRVPGVVYAVSGLGHVFIDAGGVWQRVRRSVVRRFYGLALGASNKKVIFQNEFDRREVQRSAGISNSESELILGSGVDVDGISVQPMPEGRTIFLMASRLLRTKGVREFCRAAEILHKRGVDAEFLLVGDLDQFNPAGISEEELEVIRQSGIVKVLGYQGDIPALMGRAHVVVLPSYSEGLPKVLIEAAASGRAIVTTDIPGCRETVESGLTGLLVPPKNSEKLADAMFSLAGDRELASKLGAAGRKRAERLFRIQDVVAKHLNIYKELLGTQV
ncbi:MAG: glycosyltransferase family 4 protein [Flaviflexus sp.]|uniref:glycosyltransferase family 4 protein n=1 Tax=Flaviflexus sp. TaxID=1969482 RepID=UPI003F90DDC2